MSAAHDNFRTWAAWYRRAQHETQDFTVDLHTLTAAEILNFSPITREFVTFIPAAFSFIHPKEHAQVRQRCAYLYELHERQTKAWAEQTDTWLNEEAELSRIMQSENRINETRSWLTRQ